MNEKIKPCPFCGGEANLRMDSNGHSEYYITNSYSVKCSICHIQTPQYKSKIFQNEQGIIIAMADGAKSAIESWNRRVIEWTN